MEGTATASAAPNYGTNTIMQYNTSSTLTAGAEWKASITGTGGVIIAKGTITMNGAKVLNASTPLAISNGASLSTGNFNLTIGGAVTAGGTFTAGTGTITYSGASQTILTSTYSYLILSGSGSLDLSGVTLPNSGTSTLSIEGTAKASVAPHYGTNSILQYNTSSTMTAGVEWVTPFTGTGGVIIKNSGAITLNSAEVLNCPFTLNSGTFKTGNNNLTFGGSVTYGGGTFTAGTGTITYSGASQTILTSTYSTLILSGSGSLNLSGVTLPNSGTSTLSLEGTATASNAPNYGTASILQYNSASPLTPGAEWVTPFVATGGVKIVGAGTVSLNASKVFNTPVSLAVNNGATLYCGISVISGTGTFTLASGGNIGIGSTAGIAFSGATGNIQTTTRTFPVGGNYTYNGTVNQNMGTGFPTGLTGILTINNSGTSPTNIVTLDNVRNLASGGSIVLSSGTFAAGTNLTLNTTTSISRSAGDMTGTIQGSGTYNVTYTGNSKNSSSELSGSGLNNVTISLTSGQSLTLITSPTVKGTLSFSVNTGKIITSTNKLTLGSSASITWAGTGQYVNGNLEWTISNTGAQTKTFPIGDGANYAPATVVFSNVTGTGTLTGSVTGANHSDISNSGIDPTKSVHHAWTLTNSGITFSGGATVTLNWVGVGTGEGDAAGTPANYIVAKYDNLNNPKWTKPTFTSPPQATSIQVTNITSFSDFQVGESSFISSTTDYFRSLTTGDWTNVATWKVLDDGSTNWNSATLAPTSSAALITIRTRM